MNIDLHMHTTHSDGTDDVNTIIDKVHDAKIDIFSITDHDTAHSAREIFENESLKQKIKNYNLKYIVGTEFSCVFENKVKMHILAYDFDPFAPEVRFLEDELAKLLKEKDDARMKYIEDAGYVFSKESLEFLKSRENVRKLDLANCLVNDGYFKDLEDAIQNFLEHFKKPKIYRLDAKMVVETLSKIGAKMVWAHPIHGINEKPISFEEVERVAGRLKPYGLVGLECNYCLYNKEEIEKLKGIATKLDLFTSAGSDYHGKNKKVSLLEVSADGTSVDFSNSIINAKFNYMIGWVWALKELEII